MPTRRTWLFTAALAAPLLFTLGCDDDDDDGTGPDATLQVVAGLSDAGGTVDVSDGGTAVDGATVTLNGTAATPSGTAGEYDLVLAAPVPAGGALTLDVSSGGAVVQGTGTVPEAAVITAPTDASTFDAGSDIEVTWTATASPDRWVVDAEGPVATQTFPVADGAARTFTIPGGSLADGAWEIEVIAVDDGGYTGDTEAGSTLEVQVRPAVAPSLTIAPTLLVRGSAMGPEFQNVLVSQGGTTVDGAAVTVNGTALTQTAPGAIYSGQLPAPVAVGGAIDLDVTAGALVVEGLGTVPEPAVVTAPADAAAIAVTAPIDVTWTATADPDRWVVDFFDGAANYSQEVAGTARTATFAPGAIPVGGPYTIRVYSFEDGAFTGSIATGSRMAIRNENAVQPDITVIP
ncbi:MAG TPA: hypothetical protein VJ773_01345 [Gemmatimonadales bacterium]|nr:hypothetical protein [Gemmatimonadales bacterium]